MHRLIVVLMIITFPACASAQVILKGRVMDSKSDIPLQGVTIFNKSQKIYKKAGIDGQYTIFAYEKDTVIFSFTGYRPDTITVFPDRLQNGLDIGLKALPPVLLDTVTVTSRTYSEDSLRRREEYSEFYAKPIPGLTGGNTPSAGFGISISPFSYFSSKERSKRALKKRLAYNEQQAYIDSRFSPSYVNRLTGLTGPTLQKFMLVYRPSFASLRGKNNEDLVVYINESLKAFHLQSKR